MEVNINGISLDKVTAVDTEGIHVILGEGDEMLQGYYIDEPCIHAQGSNFAWLKKNLEKARFAHVLRKDMREGSL